MTSNAEFPVRETSRPNIRSWRAITPYKFKFLALAAKSGAEPVIDLRPAIQAHGMQIRDQGARGTCSVFALTCLLEFMYCEHLGASAADLSEEYLNYASNLAINEWVDGGFFWALDDGYQAQGMLHETELPYQASQIPSATLSASLLELGRRWPRLQADFIKPWNAAKGASQAQLNKALSYLDAHIPVAFGGWWPDGSIAGTTQILGVDVMNVPPASEKGQGLFDGHSVVLVGYGKHKSFPGGGYFIFRNSWSKTFGDNGYGYMPFAYVLNYANDLLAYKLYPWKGKSLALQSVSGTKNRLDIIAADSKGGVKTGVWQSGQAGNRWRAWWPVVGGKTAAGGPVTLVSRHPGQLDAFVTGQNGQVYTAAWNGKEADGLWQGWWQIKNVPAKAGYPISVVARKPDLLDLFVVGQDGQVYTAAWDPRQADGAWRGWWPIPGLKAKAGAWVSVVARQPDQLDLFTTRPDGSIYTASWNARVEGGKWRGWWDLKGAASPGSPVTAVSRSPDQLDLFTVGQDGGVWTTAWNPKENDGKWKGWWRILDGKARKGSPVAAVSRSPNQLDIFIIGEDAGVWTAAWEKTVEGGKWRGWWRIKDGLAAPAGGIAAASRSPNHLDVFVIGKNGAVWTAAWEQGAADNQWMGWWQVG